MSQKIPQELIGEILEKVSLKDEIAKRLTLKKAGHEYHGLCPFHSEKTPSFTVSPKKNFFYCFGCGASGNVINFIMRFDQREFLATIEMLADSAGIHLPSIETDKYHKTLKYKQLLNHVTSFYTNEIKKNKEAIDYLKNRKINQATIEHFSIGLAPNTNTNWSKIFNIENDAVIESGLGYFNDNKQLINRFKGRIIFPIKNTLGDVIGFGARKIKDTAFGPKYINSPETILFKKSHELYGLYEAKKHNKSIDSLIVVEGYMDVVALFQHGIYNAVASLGTAINQNHIKTLTKHVKKIYFCFDGDSAGKKAAWKSINEALPLMAEEIHLNFIFLPEKEDPDSYINKHSKEEFKNLIRKSTPAIDFLFKYILEQYDISTITGRSHAANTLNKIIEPIPNSVFKHLLEQEIAEKLAIKKTSIATKKSTNNKIENNYNDTLNTVISMLLQEPQAAQKINIPPLLAALDNNKIKWIIKIVAACQNHKNINTAGLLHLWEEHPAYDNLVKASIITHLLPNKLFMQHIQELLNMANNKLIETKINAIIQDSKSRNLSAEEKLALNNLILLKKQNPNS